MSSKDLAQIVSLAKKGQEEAMAELIHEIEKPLFRYLFHLCGNEALAQDLCQESLVKILTKIDQIKDDSGVMSWVYQVGRNQFIDETRKNKTRNSLS
ncbi:MAG: RNA polymerase sigma factor, partial [Bdellovibrionales bacterium]|nr:RNA polymerase sigma factor [Bdellovibrionales bacterium]